MVAEDKDEIEKSQQLKRWHDNLKTRWRCCGVSEEYANQVLTALNAQSSKWTGLDRIEIFAKSTSLWC